MLKYKKYVVAFVNMFIQSRLYNFCFKCNGLSVRSNHALSGADHFQEVKKKVKQENKMHRVNKQD